MTRQFLHAMTSWRMNVPRILVCVLLILVASAGAMAVDYGQHRESVRPGPMPMGLMGGDCAACHCRDEDFAVILEDGDPESLYVDREQFMQSVHGDFECEDCHWEITVEDDRPQPRTGETVSQEWLDAYVSGFPERGQFVLHICASCHKPEAETYEGSIHAQAVKEGHEEAPLCVDCHGTHTIRAMDDLESSVSDANVPATCAHCHADAVRMSKLDVRTDTVMSYEESFHGKKSRLGEGRAAVCSSCHGHHDIQSPSDPESRLSAGNRVATCAECHPQANEKFAFSFAHKTDTREGKPIVFFLATFYRIAILGTIGGMAFYIALDLMRRILNQRKSQHARHR